MWRQRIQNNLLAKKFESDSCLKTADIFFLKTELAVMGKHKNKLHNTQHKLLLHFVKKKFEKGIFAQIYYLFASEQLLVYLLPILSQKQTNK